MEVYPEEINVVFLYNLCATLISAPVCLFATKDLSSFLLKPGLPLASVMFSVRIKPCMLLQVVTALILALCFSEA